MTTHKITKYECLSLIAKRYGTTVEILQKLNPDQIENIDLIYEGKTLNLPVSNESSVNNTSSQVEPLVQVSTAEVKRIPLPSLPTELAQGNTTCSAVNIPYIDILYVPVHPKTGKKEWYAVTKDAISAINQEKDLLNEIVDKKDKKEKLTYLNELGVLSKIQTKTHYQFLNSEQVSKYQELIYQITVIRSGADKLDKKNKFILIVAKQHGMNFNEDLMQSYVFENIKDISKKFLLSEVSTSLAEDLYKTYHDSERQLEINEKAIGKVRQDLIKLIEDKIDSLKQQAENAAKKKKSDDGTNFVFSKENQFFTSKKQENVAKRIKDTREKRPVKEELIYFSKDELNEYYDDTFPSFAVPTHPIYSQFEVVNLNALGYVLIEQCLSRAHLIGTDPVHDGPKALKNIEWRKCLWLSVKPEPLELNSKIITNLYQELLGGQNVNVSVLVNEKGVCDWAYYPTQALISVINITLEETEKAFKSLLGNGVKGFETPKLKQLLWIKNVALARKEALESIAQQNAQQNKSLSFINENNKLDTFTVILDESNFKVKEKKTGVFVNQAGANDIQVVECCFMSDGKFFRIRGPHWYMPENDKDKSACCHVKKINAELPSVDLQSNSASVGKSFEDGIKDLKKSEVKVIDLSKQIEVLKKDNKIWEEGYHYKAGVSPNGQSSSYAIDAEAQFMRFVSSGEGKLIIPGGELKGLEFSNSVGLNAEIKSKLNILSAQLGFETWLPLHEKNNRKGAIGFNVSIPYRKSNEEQNDSIEQYGIGALCMKLSGQVYGVAGASFLLSGGIAFGPSDESGGIGIRGSSINIPEYNLVSTQQANGVIIGGASNLTGVAAEAKVEVDVFAGVEAGGRFSCSVYWKPKDGIFATDGGKQSTDYELLGKLNAQASVNYGLGVGREFRLTYQDGLFIVIAAARLVSGPGCSGKVAIELNPNNADRFITCCLNILNQSGFKHLALFGDRDESGVNEDFVKLNEYLTVAITLGLTFGEVILLPPTLISHYQTANLRKEYAPILAEQMLSKDKRLEMQKWIKNLPPETLSKLFSCLIQSQYEAEDSKLQVQALLQILGWITPKSSNDAHCKQFEKALILMNGEMESQQSALTQWNSFKFSWWKLALFIKTFGDYRGKDQFTFNKSCKALCQNMSLYKVKTSIILGTKTEYICFYNKDVKDNEIKEIRNTLEEKLDKKDKIDWSTYAI
jgi:LysM repeat protein